MPKNVNAHVTINPAGEDFSDNPTHKIAPTLIINPDEDAMCMQDEIFGPILRSKHIRISKRQSAISMPSRPWRLFFGQDKAEEKRFWKAPLRAVCRSMMSCSTCCKKTCRWRHQAQRHGLYHGIEGFKPSATQKHLSPAGAHPVCQARRLHAALWARV